jgi:hypothetical protein
MNINDFVVKSLELHLFFGRIMKEHSLFLKAGFTPANATFSAKAEFFMKEFDKLLCQAVFLSNGIISNEIICSGEIVTEFTSLAEKQTQRFTGIHINKEITEKELHLNSNECKNAVSLENKCSSVHHINQNALRLLDGLIAFKENILKNVLQCQMFTVNYPLLIEHIIKEAKLYRSYIIMLEKDGCLSENSIKEKECFWNEIMMEHALFIRGLLDPCETDLFNLADSFAKEYALLLDTSRNAHNRMIVSAETNRNIYNKAITSSEINHNSHNKAPMSNSLEETTKFRNFKQTATQGIQQCNIRSIILPLLADHVLREANHYIRILKC